MAEENSRKRLGRGLQALIGDPAPVGQASGQTTGGSAGQVQPARPDRTVPVEHIRANSNNPRRYFNDEELAELSASIKQHGIVQPLLVRPLSGKGTDRDLGGARYEIVAGERRWRAAQRAGLHEIPVVIRELADRQALEIAIIENVQRSDLGALEEAQGYQQLIDEYDYSQAELANVIGKSRSHVANTLRLLKLPEAVRDLLVSGQLSAGHARTLIASDNPQKLAARIVKEGLSVRQAEALAQEAARAGATPPAKSGRAPETRSADVKALEKHVSDVLGLKVMIASKQDGSGELRIRYRTLEQLDGVCRRLEHGV